MLRWFGTVPPLALPAVSIKHQWWFRLLRAWAPGERADCAACHRGPPPPCMFGGYDAPTECTLCARGLQRLGGYATNAYPLRNSIRRTIGLFLRKLKQPRAKRTLLKGCPFECWQCFQDLGWGRAIVKCNSSSQQQVEIELVGDTLEAFLELQSAEVGVGWGSALYSGPTEDLRVCTRLLLVFTRKTSKAGIVLDSFNAHFDAAILSHTKVVRLDDVMLLHHNLWERYDKMSAIDEDSRLSLIRFIEQYPARMLAAGYPAVAELVSTRLLPPCNI
jgi:hypothetical protein